MMTMMMLMLMMLMLCVTADAADDDAAADADADAADADDADDDDPPTSGSASAVDNILKRKNKDRAPKCKESKKKRGRAGAVDDDRGRFSRFEAVASEVIALSFESARAAQAAKDSCGYDAGK